MDVGAVLVFVVTAQRLHRDRGTKHAGHARGGEYSFAAASSVRRVPSQLGGRPVPPARDGGRDLRSRRHVLVDRR